MATAAAPACERLSGKVAPVGVGTPLGIVSYLEVFALIKAALSLSLTPPTPSGLVFRTFQACAVAMARRSFGNTHPIRGLAGLDN